MKKVHSSTLVLEYQNMASNNSASTSITIFTGCTGINSMSSTPSSSTSSARKLVVLLMVYQMRLCFP